MTFDSCRHIPGEVSVDGRRRVLGQQRDALRDGPARFPLLVGKPESVLPEALFPAHDGGRGGLELSLDRVEGRAFGQHQNQLGAKHISGGQSRDWAMLLRSECCCWVSKISLPLAMTAWMLTG